MKYRALENLRKHLPPHEVVHCEAERLETPGRDLFVAGIAVRLEDGLEIFGSSSAGDDSCLLLASFEVLERYVVLKAKSYESHNTERFKLSISNGVAIHQSEELAKQSALLELVERHEILKSWFLNSPIKDIIAENSYVGPREIQGYEMKAREFSTDSRYSVIGIFAFPFDKSKAPIYGFGSSFSLLSASEKAQKEFWMRMGFVGEEIVNECPGFSCTPGYHQDFYLYPGNTKHLLEWLDVKNKADAVMYPPIEYIGFANLTPPEWQDLYVMKAVSKGHLKLFFGDASFADFDITHRCDIPHPIT